MPWNPRKALSSPFIIYRSTDDDVQRPTSSKQVVSDPEVHPTPKSRHDLYHAVSTLQQAGPVDRTVRTLFSKTGRALDRMQFQLADTERQLASYKRQVDEYRAKSKRKEAVDMNKVFVNIEDIKRTYDRIQLEPSTTRSSSTRTTAAVSTQRPAQTTVDPFQRVAQQLRAIRST